MTVLYFPKGSKWKKKWLPASFLFLNDQIFSQRYWDSPLLSEQVKEEVVAAVTNIPLFFSQPGGSGRDHICHKQYKQRLCKIIITRVKVPFVGVFLVQLK